MDFFGLFSGIKGANSGTLSDPAAAADAILSIEPPNARLVAMAERTGSRDGGPAVASALCERDGHRWLLQQLPLTSVGIAGADAVKTLHAATLALEVLRNLARVQDLREVLVGAGALGRVVEFLPNPTDLGNRAMDNPPSELSVAWRRAEAAAMEALINIGCLHANKQKIVDAGAVGRLLRCIGDPDQPIFLRELSAACLGCLTHLSNPETTAAISREGVLSLIEFALDLELSTIEPKRLGRADLNNEQAALVYGLVDLLKNVVMHSASRSAVLSTGQLVEQVVAIAVSGGVPPKTRVNAAQALRIVACGPDDDGALHEPLVARGYSTAVEAAEQLMEAVDRGEKKTVSLSVLKALAPANAEPGAVQCIPCEPVASDAASAQAAPDTGPPTPGSMPDTARLMYMTKLALPGERPALKGEPLPSRPLRTRALQEVASKFLLQDVIPKLQPLTEEEYMDGPMAIVHTAARYTYVYDSEDGGSLLWCIDWKPGILVIRIGCDGALSWAAVQKPCVVNPEEWEDIPDPAYILIYDAWDAECGDISDAERSVWAPPSPKVTARYESVLQSLNDIAVRRQSTWADLDAEGQRAAKLAWLESCRSSPIFAGSTVM